MVNQNTALLESVSKYTSPYGFATAVLPLVSRTFALNIAYLKGDLHKAVLTGYLFCRILDTLEDSKSLSFDEKIKALEIWAQGFPFKKDPKHLESFNRVLNSEKEFSDNSFENLLLENNGNVFTLYYELDPSIQTEMVEAIQTMAGGMASFQKMAKDKKGEAWIEDLDQLEKYCYYVAGTVGEMLTKLFLKSIPGLSEKQRNIMKENAVPFGLGLQLTNIIKDFDEDSQRNWCYIPKVLMQKEGLTPKTFSIKENKTKAMEIRTKLIHLACGHLDKALEYCFALPRTNRESKLFCLIPLHLAIQTLAKIKNPSDKNLASPNKISRQSVKKTLLYTEMTFPSNYLQETYYNKFRKKL